MSLTFSRPWGSDKVPLDIAVFKADRTALTVGVSVRSRLVIWIWRRMSTGLLHLHLDMEI